MVPRIVGEAGSDRRGQSSALGVANGPRGGLRVNVVDVVVRERVGRVEPEIIRQREAETDAAAFFPALVGRCRRLVHVPLQVLALLSKV